MLVISICQSSFLKRIPFCAHRWFTWGIWGHSVFTSFFLWRLSQKCRSRLRPAILRKNLTLCLILFDWISIPFCTLCWWHIAQTCRPRPRQPSLEKKTILLLTMVLSISKYVVQSVLRFLKHVKKHQRFGETKGPYPMPRPVGVRRCNAQRLQ